MQVKKPLSHRYKNPWMRSIYRYLPGFPIAQTDPSSDICTGISPQSNRGKCMYVRYSNQLIAYCICTKPRFWVRHLCNSQSDAPTALQYCIYQPTSISPKMLQFPFHAGRPSLSPLFQNQRFKSEKEEGKEDEEWELYLHAYIGMHICIGTERKYLGKPLHKTGKGEKVLQKYMPPSFPKPLKSISLSFSVYIPSVSLFFPQMVAAKQGSRPLNGLLLLLQNPERSVSQELDFLPPSPPSQWGSGRDCRGGSPKMRMSS